MKKREQDGYNVKVDAKYGNYIKLGIAALTQRLSRLSHMILMFL
jgi:hypothetical protein